MTFRGVIFGLLGAVFIGTAGYVTSFFKVPAPTRGHLPISIFGMLFLVMALFNPLLHWMRASWRLRSKEIAVALGMMLVACNIPHAGLMRVFSSVLLMPLHHNKTMPGWRKVHVLSYTPGGLLVTPPEGDDSRVVNAFLTGLGRPGEPIGMGDVPWANWVAPLSFWVPIIVLAAAAAIALSVIVHHQWAHRERLRYPIAEFANTLIRQDRRGVPIFRQRIFWLGMLVVFSIRVFNWANTWADTKVQIPLSFTFEAIRTQFPLFASLEGARYIIEPMIIPTAVAFTFFLASDIGLSLGVTNLITVAIHYTMVIRLGMTVSHATTGGGVESWVSFGAFLGYTLVLLYLGRRYYGQTLKRALLGRAAGDTTPSGAWAVRFFLLSSLGMTALLAVVGLGWPLALLTIGIVMIMFLVLARITAECGVFFFKPAWTLVAVVGGLFSIPVLGPTGTIVIGMLMIILLADPFEALIPYVINGLRISERAGVPPGRTSLLQVLAFVVTLAAAIPVGLWADYNFGKADQEVGSGWAKVPFTRAERGLTTATVTGQLSESLHGSPWQRLRHAKPNSMFVWSVTVGLVGVLLLGGLRLRFPWWPLHPIVLLGYGAWTMSKFGASFLLGWAIKYSVTHLGGVKAYEQGRRFMIGVIVGDLCGGLLYMASNYIYYAATGTQVPRTMMVLW